MDKQNNFEKIKQESQRIFLVELKEKTKDALFSLSKFRQNFDNRERHLLINYFHSVKGTSAMLEFVEIAKISESCESMLEESTKKSDYTHKMFSALLEGIGKITLEADAIAKTLPALTIDNSNSKSSVDSTGNNYIYSLISQTLLLVDDDTTVISMLDKIFRDVGFNVLFTINPKEVFEIIENNKVDLLLLDFNMPDMSGIELFSALKKNNIDIPAIFITSEDDISTKLSAFNLGAQDYIHKPFDVEEVIARVESVLGNLEKSKSNAYQDQLTGAFTKNVFNHNFKIARTRYLESDEPFSVALIDIDSFKTINDKYSYSFGDKTLGQFYSQIKNHLPLNCQIYRIDGDNFLILFPDLELVPAFKSVENARKRLAEHPFVSPTGEEFYLTFSAGITSMFNKDDNIFEVLEQVQNALNTSKKDGKNKTTISKFIESFSKIKPYDLSKGIRKILVIEDSTVMSHFIRQQLESLNFEVQTSNDSDKGILKSKVFRPDLVIIDLMLPSSSGFEVVDAIRAIPELKNTKFLMITSQNKIKNVHRCLELRLDGFLVKPFTMHELETRVKRVLSQ